MSRPIRFREPAARAALVAGSLVAALALCEAALRIAGFSYSNFGTPDPVSGWAFRPNAEGWIRGENPAGVYVRLNSGGFRDREHTVEKPAGTLRIAVLGDSYAEAFQVETEAAFWAVMERNLAACAIPGVTSVEALNFGIGGYGTAQQLLTLREKAWKYQPGIVLLTITTGNDIRDNLRALSQQPAAPYFVYRGEQLTLDDSFRALIRDSTLREWEAAVRTRLRLAQLARLAWDRMKQVREAGRQEDGKRSEAGLDDHVYRPPQDEDWREAWRVTEGILRLMNGEAREHGARLWIATLTNGIQVHPDAAARQAFIERLGVDTLFYPNMRIREFGRREGIPVITIVEAMAEYARSNHVFLHGFGGNLGVGHWNETGHKLAGELIAAELCNALSAGGRYTR